MKTVRGPCSDLQRNRNKSGIFGAMNLSSTKQFWTMFLSFLMLMRSNVLNVAEDWTVWLRESLIFYTLLWIEPITVREIKRKYYQDNMINNIFEYRNSYAGQEAGCPCMYRSMMPNMISFEKSDVFEHSLLFIMSGKLSTSKKSSAVVLVERCERTPKRQNISITEAFDDVGQLKNGISDLITLRRGHRLRRRRSRRRGRSVVWSPSGQET